MCRIPSFDINATIVAVMGVGVGIDRVLIMLTGESIRETTLFPLVRPQ